MLNETRKGIAAYQREQNIILQVIKDNGGRLTQQGFNKEFASFQRESRDWTLKEIESGEAEGTHRVTALPPKHRFGLTACGNDTFILGGIGSGLLSKWIDLLQHMCTLGLVKKEGMAPNIVYVLEKKP